MTTTPTATQENDDDADLLAQLRAVAYWKLEPVDGRWRFAHPVTGATIAMFEHKLDALAVLDVFDLAEDLDAQLAEALEDKARILSTFGVSSQKWAETYDELREKYDDLVERVTRKGASAPRTSRHTGESNLRLVTQDNQDGEGPKGA